MAYQPNIPLATDRIKDSQADIQGNFQELNTYLNVNHTAIDGTASQGKHKWVTMPIQVAAPGTLANELAMYTKLSALTGLNEVFIQRSSNGSEIQLTGGTLTGSLLTGNSQGFITLGNGFIIKWFMPTPFNIALLSEEAQTRNFLYPVAAGIPAFTTVPFYVNATLVNTQLPQINTNVGATNTTLQASVTVYNPLGSLQNFNNVQVLIIAIGR